MKNFTAAYNQLKAGVDTARTRTLNELEQIRIFCTACSHLFLAQDLLSILSDNRFLSCVIDDRGLHGVELSDCK